MCSRVISVVAEVGRQRRTQRSARCSFTRKDGERGRGSSASMCASAKAPRSEDVRKDAEGWIVVEDVTWPQRDQRRSAQERGCPLQMEVTSDRSANLIVTEGLANRSWPPRSRCSCESAAAQGGSDRGVRGTARRKCEEETRLVWIRASPLKRIRRRETPDSPVFWSWVQAYGSKARREPRRDAGSQWGASARSWSSGKHKSVSTYRGRASRHVARQTAEGRSSSWQVVESADAGNGGSEMSRDGLSGRRASVGSSARVPPNSGA